MREKRWTLKRLEARLEEVTRRGEAVEAERQRLVNAIAVVSEIGDDDLPGRQDRTDVRDAILRLLAEQVSLVRGEIVEAVDAEAAVVDGALRSLVRTGRLVRDGKKYREPTAATRAGHEPGAPAKP